MKPLIIGQAPGIGYAERPEPVAGRCGGRLAALCGLSLDEFLSRFDRENLVPYFPGRLITGDRFVGRVEARDLAERFRSAVVDRRVVVLGFSTATAFRLTHPAFTFARHWGGEFAFCPHPSGVNRWWNDPENLRLAAQFWRRFAAEQ
jgi:uracil-DNA glycosylase